MYSYRRLRYLHAVDESIETFEQLEMMGRLVRIIQDYLISRPLPADAITASLVNKRGELEQHSA